MTNVNHVTTDLQNKLECIDQELYTDKTAGGQLADAAAYAPSGRRVRTHRVAALFCMKWLMVAILKVAYVVMQMMTKMQNLDRLKLYESLQVGLNLISQFNS